MAKVKDAGAVERMIRLSYPGIMEPKPFNFNITKQGYTWIAKYSILSPLMGVEEHERHINANTGEVKMIR